MSDSSQDDLRVPVHHLGKRKFLSAADLRPSHSAEDLIEANSADKVPNGHHHRHHRLRNHLHHHKDNVERSAKSEVALPREDESPTNRRHGLVKRYLTTLNQKSRKKLQTPETACQGYVPLKGVNLRDVGAVTKGPMRENAIFRSSELLSKMEMQCHNIKTILDLRRMDRPCKAQKGIGASESTTTILKYLLWGPKKIIPEKRLIMAHRAHPRPCPLCHARAQRRYDADINVIHADLIPSTVGLRIFTAMPWKIQLKSVACACTGKGAGSVMAPAVANNKLLGYKALYRTLLEDSKRGMAMAIRPFTDVENYPILVHCIHGKDRTGLIIMLLLMLCDVDTEIIVDDYIMSETVLRESRMHQELHLDVYLTSDDVIAATRETMEDTINYVNDKYGSAANYLKECGLEESEITSIKQNLVKKEELLNAEPMFKPKNSVIADALQNFGNKLSMPFGRRVSVHDKMAKSNKMGQGLTSQKSTSLEEVKRSSIYSGEGKDPGNNIRRVSLATTSTAEIRNRLAKLREQHPELGPLSEAEPVDFLRSADSPPQAASSMKSKKRFTMHSLDLGKEVSEPNKQQKWLLPPKLKKTISLPPSPSPHHTAAALSHIESLKSELSAESSSKELNGSDDSFYLSLKEKKASQQSVGSDALLGNGVNSNSQNSMQTPNHQNGGTIFESKKLLSPQDAPPSPFKANGNAGL